MREYLLLEILELIYSECDMGISSKLAEQHKGRIWESFSIDDKRLYANHDPAISNLDKIAWNANKLKELGGIEK